MPILNETHRPIKPLKQTTPEVKPVINKVITPNKGTSIAVQKQEQRSTWSGRPEEVLTQQIQRRKETSCDFCGHEESKENLKEVMSINSKFKVCPNCYKYFQQKQCIICHKPLSEQRPHQDFEWKGLCFECAQLVLMKAAKLEYEIEQGVDFESSMEVVNNRDQELTEEEFNTLLSVAKPFLNSVKTDKT